MFVFAECHDFVISVITPTILKFVADLGNNILKCPPTCFRLHVLHGWHPIYDSKFLYQSRRLLFVLFIVDKTWSDITPGKVHRDFPLPFRKQERRWDYYLPSKFFCFNFIAGNRAWWPLAVLLKQTCMRRYDWLFGLFPLSCSSVPHSIIVGWLWTMPLLFPSLFKVTWFSFSFYVSPNMFWIQGLNNIIVFDCLR